MIERFEQEILIVGAGPAGIAAAIAAAEHGKSVGLVDDNIGVGGQIWRGQATTRSNHQASRWIERLERSHVQVCTGVQVIGCNNHNMLICECEGDRVELAFDRLILATGARERFVPFPGWTLPNVTGVGGLQAMVKAGLPIAGKTVAIVGSGPLLLAVAAALKEKGAHVVLVAEQSPRDRVSRFALGLWRSPHKLAQAAVLRWQLASTPVLFGTWPERANGDSQVRSVTLTNGRKSWTTPCDWLATGFGLVPNLELAHLLGCQVDADRIKVDEYQQTTRRGLFSAGETGGIGGLDTALIEGRIAGHTAAGRPDEAKGLFLQRDRARRFARSLDSAFALRDELRNITRDDTVVCRCEDVRFQAVREFSSALDAKLQTRCGMGPCQARICGPSLEFLLGWSRGSVRPPILPAELATLAGTSALSGNKTS